MSRSKTETNLTEWQQAAIDAGVSEADWINGKFKDFGWDTYYCKSLEVPTFMRGTQPDLFAQQQEMYVST